MGIIGNYGNIHYPFYTMCSICISNAIFYNRKSTRHVLYTQYHQETRRSIPSCLSKCAYVYLYEYAGKISRYKNLATKLSMESRNQNIAELKYHQYLILRHVYQCINKIFTCCLSLFARVEFCIVHCICYIHYIGFRSIITFDTCDIIGTHIYTIFYILSFVIFCGVHCIASFLGCV